MPDAGEPPLLDVAIHRKALRARGAARTSRSSTTCALPFARERITCLFGPSGCGKTTALRIVTGARSRTTRAPITAADYARPASRRRLPGPASAAVAHRRARTCALAAPGARIVGGLDASAGRAGSRRLASATARASSRSACSGASRSPVRSPSTPTCSSSTRPSSRSTRRAPSVAACQSCSAPSSDTAGDGPHGHAQYRREATDRFSDTIHVLGPAADPGGRNRVDCTTPRGRHATQLGWRPKDDAFRLNRSGAERFVLTTRRSAPAYFIGRDVLPQFHGTRLCEVSPHLKNAMRFRGELNCDAHRRCRLQHNVMNSHGRFLSGSIFHMPKDRGSRL